MKNTYTPLLVISLFILACNSPAGNNNSKAADSANVFNDTAVVTNDDNELSPSSSEESSYAKIVKLDYQENAEILNILPLLPDSSMGTWKWEKNERSAMVNSLINTGQFLDTTENYNTITKLTPNYFQTQVVDGLWSASLYKIAEHNFVVITSDVAGDGYFNNAYQVIGKEIKELQMSDLFGKDPEHLLLRITNEGCRKLILDNSLRNYDFSDSLLVRISSSYFTKKDNGDCLVGNELIYKFNRSTKKFDFLKTHWRSSE
ncbi:MAG: hypothetical protein V4687_17665 [Bacteroidota bacterium]